MSCRVLCVVFFTSVSISVYLMFSASASPSSSLHCLFLSSSLAGVLFFSFFSFSYFFLSVQCYLGCVLLPSSLAQILFLYHILSAYSRSHSIHFFSHSVYFFFSVNLGAAGRLSWKWSGGTQSVGQQRDVCISIQRTYVYTRHLPLLDFGCLSTLGKAPP